MPRARRWPGIRRLCPSILPELHVCWETFYVLAYNLLWFSGEIPTELLNNKFLLSFQRQPREAEELTRGSQAAPLAFVSCMFLWN